MIKVRVGVFIQYGSLIYITVKTTNSDRKVKISHFQTPPSDIPLMGNSLSIS